MRTPSPRSAITHALVILNSRLKDSPAETLPGIADAYTRMYEAANREDAELLMTERLTAVENQTMAIKQRETLREGFFDERQRQNAGYKT